MISDKSCKPYALGGSSACNRCSKHEPSLKDSAIRGAAVVCLLVYATGFGLAQNCRPSAAGRSSHATKSGRVLLIQAEDLGMAHSIDKATFEAMEKGWVTTANILVPAPWFPEVKEWSLRHGEADLGIELDLNSDWIRYRWRPVSATQNRSSLADPDGYLPLSDYYVAQHAASSEAEAELRAQIEIATRNGLRLTHLDNHMHAMLLTPALFQVYWNLGQEFSLPLALQKQLVHARGTATLNGDVFNFGGVDIDIKHVAIDQLLEVKPGFARKDWLSAYENALKVLPEGIYLLSVHLGFNDEELQAMTADHPDWGAQWRQNDYDVISSAEFHKFLKEQGFTLVNWRELQERAVEQH